MSIFNHQQRQLKNMYGMAAVEFTILMAFIFAPLVLGTVEIGRVLYQYNNITKSVRAGARYISLYSVTYPGYTSQVAIAKCIVVFGNTGCTGNAIVPSLTTGQVNITTSPAGGPGMVAIQLVKVSVTGYSLGYVTNFFGVDPKVFNEISVTMRQ